MKTAIKLFLAVFAILAVCVIGLVSFGGGEFETKLNTGKVAWLPPEASNVSRMARSGFGWMEFIECDIPEAQFLSLAAKKGWALSEFKEKYISRQIEGLPPLRTHPELGPVDVIQNGFVSESRAPNGGGYTVYYDRDLNRMIFSSSHR